MSILLIIGTIALMGFIAIRYAQQKGRDPVVWFWFGALFGLIALIVLYFLKEKVPPLQVHSKNILPRPQEEGAINFKGVWYTLDQKHAVVGPLALGDIQKKLESGTLHKGSYLWYEDWVDWKRASEVREFDKILKR